MHGGGGGGDGDHLAAGSLGCGRRRWDGVVSSSIRSGTSLAAEPRGDFPECRRWRLQLNEGEDRVLHLASLQRAPERQDADAVEEVLDLQCLSRLLLLSLPATGALGYGGVKGRWQPRSTEGTIAGDLRHSGWRGPALGGGS
jgi:hypothetical protein